MAVYGEALCKVSRAHQYGAGVLCYAHLPRLIIAEGSPITRVDALYASSIL